MALLSRQPLSRSQQRLRGRKVSDMNDAQLRDWIDACTKMEEWRGIDGKARRGWKESRAAARAELERRSGASSNVLGEK
jgi:hypothetical protein